MSSHLGASTQPRSSLPITGALALAYGLTALVGVWAAFDRPAAWGRFILIAIGLGLMLVLAWAARRWGDAVLGPVALGCAGAAAALGAYFLLSAHWEAAGIAGKLPALRGAILWIEAHRPAILLPEDIHPNVAGGLLAILAPLAAGGCAWAWLRGRRVVAMAAALALLLALVALVFSASRGAWLGLAAGAAVALGVSVAPRTARSAGGRLLLAAGLLVILAAPVILAVFDLPGIDRLTGSVSAGTSAVGRTALWRDALALIGDYPFTGSGLGSTAMIYSTYSLLIHAPYLYHMHSLLLQLAVEQGALGAALFAALLAGTVWALLARPGAPAAAPGRAAAALTLAVLASLTALVVHGALDAGAYVSKAAPVLFLPLGLAYGLAAPGRRMAGGRRRAGLALVLAAAAAALLLPASQAAFQANLGALSQTRAELAAFHWPETPLQDVLRRPGGVALTQAEGRFRAALALDPANVTASRRLGQIALANEDFMTARRYLEAAYRAAPGQRATRQMLGELEALEGDPAGAAALWAGIDLGAGQLQGREWWYGHLGQPQRVDALRQAEELLAR